MNNTLQMPVYDEVLRVERVEPLGVAVLVGRDFSRLWRRIEQLVPCAATCLISNPSPTPGCSGLPWTSAARSARHLTMRCACMLLCDACGTGWHLQCLDPLLSAAGAAGTVGLP